MTRPSPKQIAEDLQSRILAGGIKAGELLPQAEVLAAELGVSRSAVTRAYQRLNNAGLTESTKGVGTVVLDASGLDLLTYLVDEMTYDPRGYFVRIQDPRGNDVRFDLLEPHRGVQLGPAPPDVAEVLGQPSMSEVVIRDRVLGYKRSTAQGRHRDQPMVWSVSYLPNWLVNEVPAVRDVRPGPGGIYSRIEQTLGGPLRWRGRVRGELASPDVAKVLALPSTAAVHRIRRITTAPDGRVVEVLDQRVPTKKFELSYEIPRRDSAEWPVIPLV